MKVQKEILLQFSLIVNFILGFYFIRTLFSFLNVVKFALIFFPSLLRIRFTIVIKIMFTFSTNIFLLQIG
jgi:hypothetical protein